MREDTENTPNLKGLTADYFDRRSETYDQDAIHPKLAFVIIKHAKLERGLSVLDVGTGTGRLALHAAKLIGNEGSVVAVDLSSEMLTQAHFKAGMESLTNIQFIQGDAETIELEDSSFDRILCSSAFILLSNPLKALKTWNRWLKPGGIVSFDAPGEPFGINTAIAEIATDHGIDLPYATMANTTEKCRKLLEGSGFEMLEVSQELMQEHEMNLDDALAVWDKSIAHPAWHQLAQLPANMLEPIRLEFVAKVEAAATNRTIISKIVMNVATGQKGLFSAAG
jgi:ubiquinone/menaquinone biosynthesis C-methylase UbiE